MQNSKPLPAAQSTAAAELLRRRESRTSFDAWCSTALSSVANDGSDDEEDEDDGLDLRAPTVKAGVEPAAHHRLLIEKLQEVADGKLKRLMIFMPPGHAKSTYASVLFPPFYLAKNRSHSLIGASHTGKLAERFGRRSRNLIGEYSSTLGYRLSEDSQSAGQWSIEYEKQVAELTADGSTAHTTKTRAGGEFFAAGVGGAITGRRANLGLIDDPIASQADADSESVRNTLWDWYLSDFRTRLKKGGSIVIIQTRWHEDDLAGRILPVDYSGESGWITAQDGERWFVLAMPAIAERFDDLLGRNPGEALWPSEYNIDKLRQEERTLGPRKFNALYQQRPKPLEGSLFKPDKMPILPSLPENDPIVALVRGWDAAATDEMENPKADFTCGVKMARHKSGRIGVLAREKERTSPDSQEALIIRTTKADGRGCEVSLPQDPGQAGKVWVLNLARKLLGYKVHSSPESGDKHTRAEPFAAQVNIGNVYMLIGDWNRDYRETLRGFPNARYDDDVDSSSRAFSRIVAPPAPAKRTRLNIMGR